MFDKINAIEGITVIGVIGLGIAAILQGNSEIAAAAIGGLVGYLTKAAIAA